jgi:hypothetical protein
VEKVDLIDPARVSPVGIFCLITVDADRQRESRWSDHLSFTALSSIDYNAPAFRQKFVSAQNISSSHQIIRHPAGEQQVRPC